MKNKAFFVIAAMLLFGVCALGPVQPARAQEGAVPSFRDTTLKLPRWAALAGEKTYVRAGPGLKYPIRWIYKKEGLPVEIVQEFDSWRKIKDWEGGEGWVHQSLLTGTRRAMVRSEGPEVPMRQDAGADERLVARLEPAVVASIDRCTPAWCRLEVDGYRGWVQRNFLWGIYEDEELN